MALFAERDKYVVQRTTLQTSISAEIDATKKAELNTQLTDCQNNISNCYYKILAILHKNLVGKIGIELPSQIQLKTEIDNKYKSDVASENSKHNEIIKQLG